MNDMNMLDELKPIADEMLSGLQADEAMKRRIREAVAKAPAKRTGTVRRFVPAVCCAALALACVGVIGMGKDTPQPGIVQIDSLTAGDGANGTVVVNEPQLMAGLGDGATIAGGAAGANARGATDQSLFADGAGDIPLVAVDGHVYRLLSTPQGIGQGLLGGEIGKVASFTDEPSLASEEQLRSGVSNVAGEGGAVYAIAGIGSGTAVAAQVDGEMRVFQRVSYAGKGPGGGTLEDTFDVRGKAASAELTGVGTLTGEAANDVLAVLLDNATLVSADASARRQYLTVTLESGLKLQLGVSGDTLAGCGGWSCPEFFGAFEAAL